MIRSEADTNYETTDYETVVEQAYRQAIAAGFDETTARWIAERVAHPQQQQQTASEAAAQQQTARETRALCRVCGHTERVAAHFVALGYDLKRVRARLAQTMDSGTGTKPLLADLSAERVWQRREAGK